MILLSKNIDLIFNKRVIKPLHKVIITSIISGYNTSEKIKSIFEIIHMDRLRDTISDLIEMAIIEIDDVFNVLQFTEDFQIFLDNYYQIKKLRITSKKELIKHLEFIGINNPKALSRAINIKND